MRLKQIDAGTDIEGLLARIETAESELSASQAREAELQKKLDTAKHIAEVSYRKMEEAETKIRNWGLSVKSISAEAIEYRNRALAAEAKIKALQEQVPEGWVLLPVFPTVEMREAIRNHTGGSFLRSKDAYAEMLSVAPQPPKEQP